jgi:hypothetical protein
MDAFGLMGLLLLRHRFYGVDIMCILQPWVMTMKAIFSFVGWDLPHRFGGAGPAPHKIKNLCVLGVICGEKCVILIKQNG